MVNNTRLECASPSVPAEGITAVTVAFRYANTAYKKEFLTKGGSTTSSDGTLFFHFYPTETVSGLRPYEGPIRGGTAVSVLGSDFRNTPELVVRFQFSETSATATNDSVRTPPAVVPARFVSGVEVTVEMPKCPAGSIGGLFSVEVSSNGVDFTSFEEGPLFSYVASEPFVEGIAPVILREGGGEIVAIHGFGFPETYPNSLACIFGEESVSATRLSETVLTCLSSSHKPGRVVITVTSYGQSLKSDDDISVEFVGALRVLSSWPMLGSARGGTAVAVHGEGFRAEDEYLCVFGSTKPSVRGTFVNSSAIVCTTPALSRPQNQAKVTLEVRTKGNEYRYGGNTDAEIGPDATIATAEGRGGLLLAPLTFHYHHDIDILRFSPANGPISGGTVVRISGLGFLDLPEAACQFGVGEPTPARVIDESTLVCTAVSGHVAIGTDKIKVRPVANSSRADTGVPVRVTVNGIDFYPSNATAMFYYDEDIALHALVPDRGPATGGVQVIARGSGFRPDDRLACRFGLEVVPGEYVSADAIACMAPAQSRMSVVSVSVTLNGQDFAPGRAADNGRDGQGGPTFTYTARAVVTMVQPETGPTRGGTAVHVYGANFANTTMMRCRFGGTSQTVAEFVSSEDVICVSPPVPVGTGPVHLEVSDHRMVPSSSGHTVDIQDVDDAEILYPVDSVDDPTLWTNNGVEFLFTVDAEVLAVFPSSGPSSGGTRVSLTGSGFQNLPGLRCRFGGVPLGGSSDLLDVDTTESRQKATMMEVSAMYISPTEAVCVAPAQSPESLTDERSVGTVRVAITLNGQDYGLKMAQFTYYPTPQVYGCAVASH